MKTIKAKKSKTGSDSRNITRQTSNFREFSGGVFVDFPNPPRVSDGPISVAPPGL